MKTLEQTKIETGLEIKRAMKARKVTQSELAKRMGVGRYWISQFVKGENLTTKTLVAIAQALDCEVEVNLVKPKRKTLCPHNPN